MRAYWILPNRDQKDEILASDGETVLPLRRILDPTLRPEGFSHGVPTELLEKCAPNAFSEILFAQRFPRWSEGKQLFSVSAPAGLDASGRVVHLGLLFILEPGERPRFDLPYAGLPEKDKPYADALIRRMMASAGHGDSWAQSVRELSELRRGRRPATNVSLDRSVTRFDSLYVLGPRGLTRKAVRRTRFLITAIVLLGLCAVVGVSLCMQAKCSFSVSTQGEDSSRTAVQAGVATWHFN